MRSRPPSLALAALLAIPLAAPGAARVLAARAALPAPPVAPPRVLAGPFPQFVYALTTVAGWTLGDPESFREILRDRAGVTPAEVVAWGAAIEAAGRGGAPPGDTDTYPTFWGTATPEEDAVAALLGATDAADLRDRLADHLPARHVRTLLAVATRRLPAYTAWFDRVARAPLRRQAGALTRGLHRLDFAARDARAAHFLGASPGGNPGARVLLAYHPGEAEMSSGTAHGDTGVVDVGRSQTAPHVLAVAVHELQHRHMRGMARGRARALMDRLLGWGGWMDLAHVNLFEESLVTALTAVLDGNDQAPLYADVYIDRVARAFLPRIREAFAGPGTLLDGGLLEELLEAGRRALGPFTRAPVPALRRLDVGATDAALLPLADEVPATWLAEHFQVHGPEAARLEDLERYPDLSGLVLVTPPGWSRLARWGVPGRRFLAGLRGDHPAGFVARVPRPGGRAHVWVVYGPDADAVATLLEALGSARTRVTPGARRVLPPPPASAAPGPGRRPSP